MPSFIKNVAIVGATGNMGRHILDQLLAKNNHSITALTRIDSNIFLDPSVTIHEVDYNNIPNLTTAIQGHDILIITLSVTAPPYVHSNLVQAAAAAGIKYIIPNAYGFNFRNPALLDDIPAASKTASYLSEIESLGMTHFSLVCSFWYEWSLGCFSMMETPRSTSTWKLSGDAVAGIVALPVEELEAKWKDKSFFVSSFRVNQREMLDSVHRVLGTSDEDWTIEYQTSKQRYEDGNRDMQNGDFTGFARAMYARVFYPDGSGDFETSHGLDNEALDLPSEDLDAETRKVIELVNSGWNPFKRSQ
ncbi:NAD(P)-binding protein [Aureobasidium sp. EXF-8845]|nr:NAD(P)-binding protein [Aureobasidium sp. EXF-8845]KAI4847444.1 NAD(P)-binding protein [Aureobasidium sp. EXF-8846]